MSNPLPDSLRGFFDEADTLERSLAVINREQPEQIQSLFEGAFEPLSVTIEERYMPESPDDIVALLEDGEIIAVSPLEALQNAVLLVNVDLYKTGLSGIDKYEAPDVLTELDEMVFRLRGFPASTKEKLLLVVMSRFIERRALEVGEGRLDVAFQQLSRIDDEYGTRKVYERLADTDVDVHAYGVPDDEPSIDGITVHTGTDERYRRSWFVVYDSEGDEEPAALLAVEIGSNEWESMWTYDQTRVERMRQYICERF